MKKILFLLFSALFLYSCGKDNPVNTETPVNPNYTKLFTVDSAGMTYEFYSKTGATLLVGYNEIGFKVFMNGAEQKTGYVNYIPVMYHTAGPGHGTPVSKKFYFNDADGLFTGYASYIMLSDSSTSFWYGDYGYNDGSFIRNRNFDVVQNPNNQMRFWLPQGSTTLYLLTVISGKDAKIGLNDFKCILHSSDDQITYNEVDSAKIYIKPWMPSHGHGSSNNTNPVFLGNGHYQGKANYTMAGEWYLYDSIEVNNQFITPTPTFYFIFDVR